MTDMIAELINRLMAEPEGSRGLDAAIYLSEWPGCYLADEAGYIWQPGCGSVDSMQMCAPHYTTSLDAKLPWESIDAISWVDGKCHALHAANGRQEVGIGRTEPLARRIAALKAREPRDDGHAGTDGAGDMPKLAYEALAALQPGDRGDDGDG